MLPALNSTLLSPLKSTTILLYHHFILYTPTLQVIDIMATIAQLARPSIRHFSAHRPRPDSRAARAISLGCIVSGVVLPFVPPALESSRQRNSGLSTGNK
jgi:hypothetical protein